MNAAPLVVLILSMWGAIVDSRYKRDGGKKPTRRAKILFLAALLVVALFVTLMLAALLKPGSDENLVHAVAALTTTVLILLFGAWELGRWRARIKNPVANLVQDRKRRESRRGLKLAILAGLVAVLGYLALEENGWIHTSETAITAQQPNQQPQSPPQTATPPKPQDEQINLDGIELFDLEMRPLATRAITGDVRPFYLVSGRIQNSTGKTLRSVTIRIFVQSNGSPIQSSRQYNKDWQNFDEADVHVDGPIHDGIRGFSQQIQVLPPRGKAWTFEGDVIDAKVDAKAE
jgi:hypothetical protein